MFQSVLNTISDYVGFIKKVMKLLQKRYPDMRKVEVELKQMKTLQPDQNPHMGMLSFPVGVESVKDILE